MGLEAFGGTPDSTNPWGRHPRDAFDLVGYEQDRAMAKLGAQRPLVRIARLPAGLRPLGSRGRLRVIAQRQAAGRLELVCAYEYIENPPEGPGPEPQPGGGGAGGGR